MKYPPTYNITTMPSIKLSGNMKNLTNNTYGLLTVIKPVSIHKTLNPTSGLVMWLCKCSCGNYSVIKGGSLTAGVTTSCGCFGLSQRKTASIKDITGQTFNRLTAISPTNNKKQGVTIWLFECSCGNEIERPFTDVKRGNTKSCGCLHKEQAANQGRANVKDITGQVFGKLTAIERLDRRTGGGYFWSCSCSCGKKTEVNLCNLLNGAVKSCGCGYADATKKRFEAYRISKGFPATVLMSPMRETISTLIRPIMKRIMSLDNYTCQLCNKRGSDLVVHHIVKREVDIFLSCQPANLITLCTECHMLVHDNNFNGPTNQKLSDALQTIANIRETDSLLPQGMLEDITDRLYVFINSLMKEEQV